MDEKESKLAAHFERVIKNLNEHWSSIQLLLSHVSKPLLVNDLGLRQVISDITLKMKEVYKTLDSTLEKIQCLDISQTFGEIKFIGKRLDSIEKSLSEINGKGVTKKIDLSFSCDGYEMVKKSNKILIDEEIVDHSYEDLLNALNTLTPRERIILTHRFGLFGEKSKTLEETGNILKVTREPIRQQQAKALRKLRHPTRKQLVERITHKSLRKAIFGQ